MSETGKSADVLQPPPGQARGEGQSLAPAETGGGILLWLRRTVPTALVLVTLGGLAYWGHHTGWNFLGKGPHGEGETGHGESVVSVVDAPSAGSYGWCGEHGVLDCPLEHPDVAQTPKTPSVTKEDFERAKRALSARPRPENDPSCKQHLRRLRFGSAEAVEKAGIEIVPAWSAAITEAISGSGEVSFDPTRTARLSSRAPGTARLVAKKVGDPVHSGEVLALVDAAEVGKGKAEFLQALVQVRLKRKSLANLKAAAGVIPERQMREGEASLRDADARLLAAEQALVNLGLPVRAADYADAPIEEISSRMQFVGLPEPLLRSLDERTATANLLPVRTPFDGVVLTSDVIAGEMVDTGKLLFVVVDPRHVWLTLHVGLNDARFVKAGLPVKFRPDGMLEEFSGKVTWVGTATDERTRTVPVRAEVVNDTGRLRASTLGTGRIVLREEAKAIMLPSEAVQSDGGCEIVFVRHKDFLMPEGPKDFFVRLVRTGARDGANVEIIAGLLPGEVVASKGSSRLLNELKKSATVR